MLNKCCFQGRFTRDPELRTTTSGKSVAGFSLAVERRYRKEGQTEADFLDFVAWDKTAEFICRYFAKGQMAVVEAHAQRRSYQDKNGNNRTVVEFLVDDICFCGPKSQDGASRQPQAAPPQGYSQPYQAAPAPSGPPAYPQSNYTPEPAAPTSYYQSGMSPPQVRQQSFSDVQRTTGSDGGQTPAYGDFVEIEDEGDLPF